MSRIYFNTNLEYLRKRKGWTQTELANLKRIRIHDFRHSCASLLISKGASISLVSKYLGHASIKITLDIYTHLYKNELENITEKINNLV